MINNSERFGILIAVLTTLSWSIGIFPFTEAAKRFGSGALNQFRILLATLILTPLCFLVPSVFPHLTGMAWGQLVLSGIIGLAIGDYFSFSCYSILGARWGSLFGTISPGFVLLFSAFALSESINGVGIFGIFLSILGVIGISLGKKQQEQYHLDWSAVKKGVIFGFLSAICQALGLVLIKVATNTEAGAALHPIHGTWIRMLAATLVLYSFSF
jgi:drug/metabolite transporter (DMT)-like permease